MRLKKQDPRLLSLKRASDRLLRDLVTALAMIVPLAVEFSGRLGKEAAQFLNDLGDVAAADSCASKDTFVRIIRRELSCALCRGNARMYDRSLISVARVVGGVSRLGWIGQ